MNRVNIINVSAEDAELIRSSRDGKLIVVPSEADLQELHRITQCILRRYGRLKFTDILDELQASRRRSATCQQAIDDDVKPDVVV